MHTQIGIFELQMSMLYNARNSHCFFIDQKVSPKVAQAVNGIVNCYKEKLQEVNQLTASFKVSMYLMQWLWHSW